MAEVIKYQKLMKRFYSIIKNNLINKVVSIHKLHNEQTMLQKKKKNTHKKCESAKFILTKRTFFLAHAMHTIPPASNNVNALIEIMHPQ